MSPCEQRSGEAVATPASYSKPCCAAPDGRRDALLDMLWPDAELEQAAQCLNTATTKLRKVLVPGKGEASLLLTDEDSRIYRLAEQSLLWVDVDAALTLLGEAERRGRTSPEALPLLEEAETYVSKGMILQEEEGGWAAGRRATVEQARYRARLWLAEAYAQQQMPGQATTVLSHLLEEDQTDEDVLTRLMLLLHRQGMTRQALRVYERSCEVAAREEVELTEATSKLAAQLAASNRRSYIPELLTSPFSPEGIIEAVNTSKGTMRQAGTQDMEPSRRNLLQTLGVLGAEIFISPDIFRITNHAVLTASNSPVMMMYLTSTKSLQIYVGNYLKVTNLR